MMNNIILNGVNSNTIQGLIIQELPPISKPAIRTEIEEIDGRDGDLITKLGYAAYDKNISIGLYGNFDINEVIAFFNTSGVVTFSNEPDKYYNYEILDQIDFERLVRFRTANVTMHVQPFKYSTTETEQELSGIIITAEGTNLNLVNTEDGGSFTDLEIKGDTSQQTYSGKNLLPNNLTSQTINGITLTKNSDGTVLVNGTATALVAVYIIGNNVLSLSPGTYTLSGCPSNGSDSTYRLDINDGSTYRDFGSGRTFALTETLNITNVRIRIANGTTVNNLLFKPMIEMSSTKNDYEPYVGGIPSPNPDYPQEIKTVTGDNSITICGKNLFDKDNANILNASLNAANGDLTANDNFRTLYINCSPNTTYTVSKETGARFAISESNSDSVSLPMTTTVLKANNTGSMLVVTTGANAKKLFVMYYRSGTDTKTEQEIRNSIQIEVGSAATDYEAYQSQTYPISLGNIELCLINGTEDYIYKNNGTWYKHSVIGKVVLNGSENWKLSGTDTFYIEQDGYPSGTLDYPTISNYYIYSTWDNRTNTDYNTGLYRNGGWSTTRLFIRNKDYTNVNNFKTWLSTHNVEVYYLLATPTDTEITDSTLLSQLNTLENATTYAGETNVIVSGSVLTPTLYVETLTIDDPVLRITNSGNTIAKPIITLCGTGIINLSLNGEQIFVVNLSNDSYVTIDVANMEAYYNGVLKNRLVTGNYENFVLNQGENEITFTGTLYSMKISNYSRWI